MLSLTTAQLSSFLAAFVYPMARILALVSAAPVLGNFGASGSASGWC